ncbi:MAG: hypothetical protein B7X41_14200, partial [Microbacterium sp. 14-71-5]
GRIDGTRRRRRGQRRHGIVLVAAAERREVRGREGSVEHVEVFRMGSVGTPIIGRPRPSSGHRRAQPATRSSAKSPYTV